MPNYKAKELTARELIALERGDELEPVATCKDYLQVQDALQARIASLEAENAKLNRALDVMAVRLGNNYAPSCMTGNVKEMCKHDFKCHICWREYALAEAEEEKAND